MSSGRRLDVHSVVRWSRDAATATLPDGLAVLSIATGRYVMLDEIGARAAEHLREPLTVAALCERLCAEYDVAPERCRADMLRWAGELVEHAVVEIVA